MGCLFQVSIVSLLSLSYVANGDIFREFLSPEKENILFHLGSKLKSLGNSFYLKFSLTYDKINLNSIAEAIILIGNS